MNCLPVKRPSEYDGSFPTFRKPTELGYLSVNGERQFHPDNSQMKYLKMPLTSSNLHFDLSSGYSQAIMKESSLNERLDFILKWIILNKDMVIKNYRTLENGNPAIDFICYRGILTEICSTIYENKQDWLICATKYKSVIYMHGFYTDQKLRDLENQTPREKLMTYWGYKFEQYMTSDSPYGEPVTNIPVNTKEEYNIVLKGRLQNYNLLYSAETDGVDPNYLKDKRNEPSSTNRYIELKTSRIIQSERQNQNFHRYKLRKYWLQSFLAGIPKIITGFRDDDGYVEDLHVFNTKEIPKLADGLWSGMACFNFGVSFLEFVKECTIKDDPHVVYAFYWRPGQSITCQEEKQPCQHQILPEWYISAMENTT